jgi:tetratricopeptide (TPR) repeat protein
MRDTMAVLAISAACLFTSSAHSQDPAPAAPAASAEPQAQPAAADASSPPAQAQPATTPKIQSQLDRAARLRAANRNTEAAAVYNAVLTADPQNHSALVELGYLQADMKHWASAVKFLGAASDQDPSNMRLRMDLGYALEAQKQNDAAVVQFSAVAKEPGEFQDQARKELANIQGPADGAGAAGDVQQQRALQDGYDALERGDKAAARAKFESVLRDDPKNTSAQKQLGFMNLDDGKNAEAAANFAAALAVAPTDYFIALQLGYAYQSLDKNDAAHAAFAAAAASTDPKIHDAAVAQLGAAQGESASAAPTPAP